MMQDAWLIPFHGRGDSGVNRQCFLWGSGNRYIMDNHQAAAWCWAQHANGPHSILHLDAHYDMLTSRIDEWAPVLETRWNADVQTFLESTIPDEDPRSGRVLRWDNYLPLYLRRYAELVENLVFVTQKQGSIIPSATPDVSVTELDLWEAPDLLTHCVLQEGNFIVNVDIDLFFFQDSADTHPRFWHSCAVEVLGRQLRRIVDSDRCVALTIALSPDTCGGWAPGEVALYELCDSLGIDFRLPPE